MDAKRKAAVVANAAKAVKEPVVVANAAKAVKEPVAMVVVNVEVPREVEEDAVVEERKAADMVRAKFPTPSHRKIRTVGEWPRHKSK